MKLAFHKRRRLFAAGILAAFVAVWVLPAQACSVAQVTAASQTGCPDCPCPCCDPCSCSASMSACVAALPAAPAPALDKAVPAHAAWFVVSWQTAPTAAVIVPLAAPPLHRSSAPLNIRYCTFQE